MAEQLLDGADVVAVFEQVGREGVAEGVAADALGDAGSVAARFTARWIDGLVEVMTAAPAGARVVQVRVAGKTHCQPHSREAVGSFRSSAPGSAAPSRPSARSRWWSQCDGVEVAAKLGLDALRQRGDAVARRPCRGARRSDGARSRRP